MSKLLDFSDVDTKISTEKFVEIYSSSAVVSSESIADFFNSIRDKLSYIVNNLYNFNNDIITTDVNKYKHQTLSICKKIPMSAIADKKVAKPLNFRGIYLDYTKVLSRASWVVLSDLTDLLDSVIKQATTIINNSTTELKTLTYLDISKIKNSQKICEEVQRDIAKFFPYENNTTVALFRDLFISPLDFVEIFKNIDEIDDCLYSAKIEKKIEPKVKELYKLVNVIVDLESRIKIFEKHTHSKDLFIKALNVVSSEIEKLGYVYANINFLYKAIQSDCEAVIEVYSKL